MLALRITGAQLHAARALVGADVEVPERKLAVTWSLRRKTEKGLPATHMVEIMFKLPASSAGSPTFRAS